MQNKLTTCPSAGDVLPLLRVIKGKNYIYKSPVTSTTVAAAPFILSPTAKVANGSKPPAPSRENKPKFIAATTATPVQNFK